MQRSKDGGEGTAPGDDEDGELTKAAEEHRHRRMMTCGGDPLASTVALEQDEHAGSLA